ncbi:MAG: hypothetical protein ACTSRE_00530 [Promethearchaeota archaeon]
MSKKMTIRINEKLRTILISVITYAFFLGIGFLIALFIEIPQYISYPIFFIFGVLAVAIDIPDDKMKWLKLIPLFRRHFLMMHRVRLRIGISAKEGKLSSAYKFAGGMIYVILYLFFMNLAVISIKYILHFAINYSDPFRFTEAFLSLLGAGITAFIIWLTSFYRDYKKMRSMLKSRDFKKKARTITQGVSWIVKFYILFISYIIWIVGESLFMIGTQFFPEYFWYMLLGAVGFFAVLVITLILIVFMTKPGTIPPVDNNQPKEFTDA